MSKVRVNVRSGPAGPVTVTRKDGTSETVTPTFPASDIEELAREAANDGRIYELFCDRPQGWAQTLTPESRAKLIGVCLDIHMAWHKAYEKFTVTRMAHVERQLGVTFKELAKHVRPGGGKSIY